MARLLILAMFVVTVSCRSNLAIMASGHASNTEESEVFAIDHLKAMPGEVVRVSGLNLSKGLTMVIGGQSIPLNVESNSSASFIMPELANEGTVQASFHQNVKSVATLMLLTESTDSKIPVMQADPALICSDVTFKDSTGSIRSGLRNCSNNASRCTKDGETYCVSSEEFPALSKAALIAQKKNLRSTVIIAGIKGTLSDCGGDGATGCVTDPLYYPAALTIGAAGKIIEGESLAGLAGKVVVPMNGKVAVGTLYGVAGLGSMIGTMTVPLGSHVNISAQPYGDPTSPLTPTLAIDFPDRINVRAIDTVNGQTGLLEDCIAGNQDHCSATNIYRTMDISNAGNATALNATNFNSVIQSSGNFEFWDADGNRQQKAGDSDLVESNVKSGTSLFGLTGGYPSASYTLAGSLSTDDLTDFAAQMKSNTAFQYYDSAGVRYTALGDADLQALNFKAGIALGNLSLTGTMPAVLTNSPGSLSATYSASPEQITLNWASTGAVGYLLIARTGSEVVMVPSPGVTYTAGLQGADEVLYSGSSLSFTHSLLTSEKSYHYAVYSFDSNHFYSAVPQRAINYTLLCQGLAGVWIPVPGNSYYATKDFCVMKYGATNNVGVPRSMPATGAPWRSITQANAKLACENLGTNIHLISNPEWLTMGLDIVGVASNWSGGAVGVGEVNRGHSDSSPAAACETSADDSLGWVQSNCTPKGSTADEFVERRTNILSNGSVVWDLGGNTSTWIDFTISDPTMKPYTNFEPDVVNDYREFTTVTNRLSVMPKSQVLPTHAVASFWSDQWNSAQGLGGYLSGTNVSGTMFRGGWYGGGMSGIFRVNILGNSTGTNANVGFRCVRRTP